MARLALPLLETGVLLVDNIKLPLSPHDLAIGAALLNGCTNFHDELFVFFIGIMQSASPRVMMSYLSFLFISEYDPSSCQVVGAHLYPNLIPRQDPYVIHPHFPRDGGQYFMTIFQLNLEHRIGQGFQNDAILFNECLFRHTVFGSAKIGLN